MSHRVALTSCLAAAAALLVVVLAGCEVPREGIVIDRQAAASDTVIVTITGDSLPLTVTPDPVYVDRGTLVEWRHAGVDSFEVNLLRAPMVPALIRGSPGTAARAVVPEFAPDGSYKYSITIYVGSDQLIEDPRIICCGSVPANG